MIDPGTEPLLHLLWFDFFFFLLSQLASPKEESQTVVTTVGRKDKLRTVGCIFFFLDSFAKCYTTVSNFFRR